MALDIKALPVDESGNGERLERLTFDRADAFMMAHAMMIASTTAYMCDSPRAADRLKHYRDQFMALVPPALKLLRREEDISEIAIAMADSDTWDIRREPRSYWKKESRATIVVGDRSWSTWEELDDEQFEAMAEAVASIAPLSCTRIEAREEGGE